MLSCVQWYFVLAKTDASGKPHKSLSGFIVDADTPGITCVPLSLTQVASSLAEVLTGSKSCRVENKLINMGQRCSDTRIINFGASRSLCLGRLDAVLLADASSATENVVVPKENLLGKEGDGFKVRLWSPLFSLALPPLPLSLTPLPRPHRSRWAPSTLRARSSPRAPSALRSARSPRRPSTLTTVRPLPQPPSSERRDRTDDVLRLAGKTFGVPIIQHQAIGTMLAEMAIGVENSRSVPSCSLAPLSLALTLELTLPSVRSNAVWRASCAKDANDPRTTYLASIAKAYASATAVSNADKCVQIFGGAGFNTGTSTYLSQSLSAGERELTLGPPRPQSTPPRSCTGCVSPSPLSSSRLYSPGRARRLLAQLGPAGRALGRRHRPQSLPGPPTDAPTRPGTARDPWYRIIGR